MMKRLFFQVSLKFSGLERAVFVVRAEQPQVTAIVKLLLQDTRVVPSINTGVYSFFKIDKRDVSCTESTGPNLRQPTEFTRSPPIFECEKAFIRTPTCLRPGKKESEVIFFMTCCN